MALRTNTIIYCANFKFANGYIVGKVFSATAPPNLRFIKYNILVNLEYKNNRFSEVCFILH